MESITATFILLTVFLSSFLNVTTAQDDACTVIIQNGTILGFKADTDNPNKTVCAYLGVPYARPPVGPLRFKPPQSAIPWVQPLNATSQPNWCPQVVSATASKFQPNWHSRAAKAVSISEDCLILNIYTPQTTAENTSLPVMIWVHGGSFRDGSAAPYTPDKLLARKDIVLVVIQYRLGILGFLSTGDDVCPGNNGLKDQHLGIRWVHENIAGFGGDPNKVTLAGSSAGGFSAIYQLLYPGNEGLIHGIIAQSGSALTQRAFQATDPLESAKFVAARLGCPTTSSSVIVECLQTIDPNTFAAEQVALTIEGFQNLTYALDGMTPVIEAPGPDAFLTEEPLQTILNGKILNIPVLTGATEHEGSLYLALLYMLAFPAQINPIYMRRQVVEDVLKFSNVQDDTANRAIMSSFEMTFLEGVDRTSWNDSMPGLTDIISVFSFKSSVQNTAEILAMRNQSVYLYSLDHHSNNTSWDQFETLPIDHGVAHGDDLMYMFEQGKDLSQLDLQFSEILCDLWLNFIYYGNPTPTADDRFETWPLYDNEKEQYMSLNVTPTVLQDYRAAWRTNRNTEMPEEAGKNCPNSTSNHRLNGFLVYFQCIIITFLLINRSCK